MPTRKLASRMNPQWLTRIWLIRMPQFSIRELLLATALMGALLPYFFQAAQHTFRPQYRLKISTLEVFQWLKSFDPGTSFEAGGSSEGALDGYVKVVFCHAPDIRIIDAIKDGITSRLVKEGWTIDLSQRGNDNCRFTIHKGPSRWRLYAYLVQTESGESAVLVTQIYDSKPTY